MNALTCSKCGVNRPQELSMTLERPPCQNCGATSLTFTVSIEESLSISAKCMTEIIPINQARDWKQRWHQIQQDFQYVSSARTDPMSGESIHSWAQQLFSFFIYAYHLKDALKDAAPSLGLNTSDIESAITNDPRLALLANLANMDKHLKLNKVRGNYIPFIVQYSGIDDAAGNGWFLSVKIKNGKDTLDGLAVAKNAIAAWQEMLSAWEIY